MNYYQNFSPKLRMWFFESHEEAIPWNKNKAIDTRYALYPKRFYETVASLNQKKLHDYCFIGAFMVDPATKSNRGWIIDFINENFTAESYLQFTDKKTKSNYIALGTFDHSLEVQGLVPKEVPLKDRNQFDQNYFSKMCSSKFTLCPAGDIFWSMRFYEALMCKSIPIVTSIDETFRSKEESLLNYKYYLTSDEHIFREDWAEHNYQLFIKHHTLKTIK
jgi:hypothetical protein